MKRNVILSESLLVVVTIIWGLGFPITKLAVESGFGPFAIILARFFIASLILGVIYHKRIIKMTRNSFILGVFTGVFLFFGFYYQTLGAVYTTPSKNGFITQLNIVFVPFLYFFFVRKRIDIHNIIAVFIALLGLFLLAYQVGQFNTINIGDVYTFICAILVAFHVVTSSHFQKKYDLDPPTFVWVSMVTSMVFSLMLVTRETIPVIQWSNGWPLIFLGVLNTGLGFLVQSYALKVSHPTRISLIVSLEGLFGAIGSVLIIKEVLTVQIVLGGFLIISAILLTELKPFRKRVVAYRTP